MRQLAAEADARAEAAAAEGDVEAFETADAMADRLRQLAAEKEGRLPRAKRSAKVKPVADTMTASHREAISRAHGDSAPMKAARKVGIRSMAQLAGKLGVSPGFLSQVVNGVRPMPADRAEAFEKLTGSRWKV